MEVRMMVMKVDKTLVNSQKFANDISISGVIVTPRTLQKYLNKAHIRS